MGLGVHCRALPWGEVRAGRGGAAWPLGSGPGWACSNWGGRVVATHAPQRMVLNYFCNQAHIINAALCFKMARFVLGWSSLEDAEAAPSPASGEGRVVVGHGGEQLTRGAAFSSRPCPGGQALAS